MEEVLRALERDGRLTPAQIAAQTGRDENEVASLIAEAEERRLIVGYGAKIDWDQGDAHRVHAIVEVTVRPQEGVGYKAIANRIARFDEVRACYFTSGEYDLAVIVQGPDMHAISDFVGEKLATLPAVERTVTHVIMRRHKEDGVLFESHTEGDRQAVVL